LNQNQENEQNTKIQTKYSVAQEEYCVTKSHDYKQPISREIIRDTLKKVYAKEVKPVNVNSIKQRTGFALFFIMIGAFLVSGILAIKFIGFERNILIIGLILLVTLNSIGFLITTKYIRKIYLSMSRFKDSNIPSYRTILPKYNLQTQGLVYAILFCLILLGSQSVNFLIFNNPSQDGLEESFIADDASVQEKLPYLKDITLGEPFESGGQFYRMIFVKLNISKTTNARNIILEIQSWFAGKLYDKVNITYADITSEIVDLPIKIHEPDDTTIKTFLLFRNQGRNEILDKIVELSDNNIYITEAKGRIFTNPGLLPKTIEITVTIYNEFSQREPGVLSVIVSTPSVLGSVYRDSVKNNETLKSGEFWEATITFDILGEESIFEVELKIDEETMDRTEVQSI
jgi:hypothetical protein